MIETRPWGSYTVLEDAGHYKIKRVIVKPGERLSLQMHHYRSEHWVVVNGMAQVELGMNDTNFVRKGESVYVPSCTWHRLSNPGLLDLEVIEVEIGDYLKEDDIVRYEEDYFQGIKQQEPDKNDVCS